LDSTVIFATLNGAVTTEDIRSISISFYRCRGIAVTFKRPLRPEISRNCRILSSSSVNRAQTSEQIVPVFGKAHTATVSGFPQNNGTYSISNLSLNSGLLPLSLFFVYHGWLSQQCDRRSMVSHYGSRGAGVSTRSVWSFPDDFVFVSLPRIT